MGFILAILFFFDGWLSFFRSRNIKQRLERYEFENRTDAVIVRFKMYKDGVRHENQCNFWNLFAV